MSALPYFKWYPSDAEIDEKYGSMTDQELGFYHRCLNKSWINGGLPANDLERSRLMKVTPSYLKRLWPRVGRCFVAVEGDAERLVNPRQEKERANATKTSANNKRHGNANASKTRPIENAIDPPHTLARADSDSDSGSCITAVEFKEITTANGKVAPIRSTTAMSGRFEEFWAKHPGKKLRKDLAAGVWAHVITVDNEDALFECLDRYLLSQEVANRAYMNPENWLSECAAGKFEATWPEAKARDPSGKSFVSDVTQVIEARLQRGEKPW